MTEAQRVIDELEAIQFAENTNEDNGCGTCGECLFAGPIKYNDTVTKLIEEGKIIPDEKIKCQNRTLIVYHREFPKDFGCVYFERKINDLY